jgi:hypothetical protein
MSIICFEEYLPMDTALTQQLQNLILEIEAVENRQAAEMARLRSRIQALMGPQKKRPTEHHGSWKGFIKKGSK